MGIEPATLSPVGCASDWDTEAGSSLVALDKKWYPNIFFLFLHEKHLLCMLIRSALVTHSTF